jgi:hypothetical protein
MLPVRLCGKYDCRKDRPSRVRDGRGTLRYKCETSTKLSVRPAEPTSPLLSPLRYSSPAANITPFSPSYRPLAPKIHPYKPLTLTCSSTARITANVPAHFRDGAPMPQHARRTFHRTQQGRLSVHPGLRKYSLMLQQKCNIGARNLSLYPTQQILLQAF